MEGLTLASFNVNGMNVATKRRAVFDKLREVRADISFIQETHSTPAVAHLWKAEWGGQAFFSHGLSNSRGVAVLFARTFNPRIIGSFHDPQGRFLLLDFELNDEVATLGSVYAPTQDRAGEQMAFLDSLQAGLETMANVTVLLGGDFNCILDPTLDKNSSTIPPASTLTYRNGLRSFMEDAMLSDVWRDRFPSRSSFTFRRAKYASRLDLFLVSTHVTERVSNLKSQVSAQSDHSIISITIDDRASPRGPGLWKLDTTLLSNDDFILRMSTFLRSWTPPPELEDPRMRWDWLKFKIKGFIIKYSRDRRSREKQAVQELNKELQVLSNRLNRGDRDENVPIQMNSVRRELKQMEDIHANRLIFRSRSRWAHLGEKPSGYFLNLEKRQTRDRTLSSVVCSDSDVVTSNPKEILQECSKFYEDLYTQENPNLAPTQDILDAINQLDHPRLSDQAKAMLDAEPTMEELKKALTQLNSNKSPGTDGLPPEYYVKFWPFLAPHLVRSFKYSLESGSLSVEQRRGVVTLIPKRGVDRRLISNWRPVTLLNTDYKIITKMMALRLQPHLDDIIHPNQTGFLKGRFIGDNLRSIEDAISMMRSSFPDAMLVALDFTKAFDSVRWDFIRVALEWFGFGPLFSDLVDLIFNQIQTCIVNAGHTSSYFEPTRGIRQGCCVSPYLFILCVEVMATLIRQSPNILGLQLGDDTTKILQFADDSTCLLRSFSSLNPLLVEMDKFAAWSGLTINKTKSMILLPNEALYGIRSIHGIPVVDRVKILGVWFTGRCSSDDHYQMNFRPQLTKIKGICESWSARSLSIKGRVTLVNSLMISLLQYQCASILTPPQIFKDYRKMVSDFIWSGRKAKVAYSTLILPVAQGGLHVMDLSSRVEVSILQWVRRLVKNPLSNTARSLRHLLQVSDLTSYFECKLQGIPKRIERMPFYARLFELWNRYHALPPETEDDIRQEIIWNNKFITSGGTVLSNRTWESRGILRINDICPTGEDRLSSHLEIIDKYNVKCSFLDALKLRLSIPVAWRQALTPGWRIPPLPPSLSGISISLPGEDPLDILAASPKMMYRALILQANTQSTAFRRWSEPESQPLQIKSKEEWNEANLSVYRATRETKLQSLHFKIINRTVPCNKFLKQIRIKNTDACEICHLEDTILHFFLDCASVRTFWASLCDWFDRVEYLALETLSPKEFLFGVPRTFKKERIVNFILINVKFFVFRQRLFHGGKLEILQWLREFRGKLQVERHINLAEGKPNLFRKWKAIFEALG